MLALMLALMLATMLALPTALRTTPGDIGGRRIVSGMDRECAFRYSR